MKWELFVNVINRRWPENYNFSRSQLFSSYTSDQMLDEIQTLIIHSCPTRVALTYVIIFLVNPMMITRFHPTWHFTQRCFMQISALDLRYLFSAIWKCKKIYVISIRVRCVLFLIIHTHFWCYFLLHIHRDPFVFRIVMHKWIHSLKKITISQYAIHRSNVKYVKSMEMILKIDMKWSKTISTIRKTNIILKCMLTIFFFFQELVIHIFKRTWFMSYCQHRLFLRVINLLLMGCDLWIV